MKSMSKEDALKLLLDLWNKRASEDFASGWRGFGHCHKSDSLVCFLERSSNFAPLATQTQNIGIKAEALFIEDIPRSAACISSQEFRDLQPGSPILQPGSPIHALRGSKIGETGTLGAFLSYADRPSSDDPIYLLSCCHILGDSPKNIRNASGKIISKESPVCSGNDDKLDAALIALDNRHIANPINKLLPFISSQPVPIKQGDTVKKLGSKTGVTSGTFCCLASRILLEVNILDRDKMLLEFSDFIVIASEPGKKRFSDEGDSGALVVDIQGRPAALLCDAVLTFPSTSHSNQADCTSPLGIAAPINRVLAQLQIQLKNDPKRRGRDLRIILNKPTASSLGSGI